MFILLHREGSVAANLLIFRAEPQIHTFEDPPESVQDDRSHQDRQDIFHKMNQGNEPLGRRGAFSHEPQLHQFPQKSVLLRLPAFDGIRNESQPDLGKVEKMPPAGGHDRGNGKERAGDQHTDQRSVLEGADLLLRHAAKMVAALQERVLPHHSMIGQGEEKVQDRAGQGNVRERVAVQEQCSDVEDGEYDQKLERGQREQIYVPGPGMILLGAGLFSAVVIGTHPDRVEQEEQQDQGLRQLLRATDTDVHNFLQKICGGEK